VVKHLPLNHKAEGSSPTTTTGPGREKKEVKGVENKLECLSLTNLFSDQPVRGPIHNASFYS
jgi:hypothetical protein